MRQLNRISDVLKPRAAAVLAALLFACLVMGCSIGNGTSSSQEPAAESPAEAEAGIGGEGAADTGTGSGDETAAAAEQGDAGGAESGDASSADGSAVSDSGPTDADKAAADSASGGDAGNDSEEAGLPTTTAVTAPDLTVTIDSTDGKMRLALPAGWQDLSGQMATSTIPADEMIRRYPLETGCYDEASFIIGSHEKKEGSPITDLKDYTDTLFKAITGNEAFSNLQVGQYYEMTLKKSGLTAYRRDFTAIFNYRRVAYWLYTIDGGDEFYQLAAWTTANNSRTAEVTFRAIANTFEIPG